jgi:hypothetical protein
MYADYERLVMDDYQRKKSDSNLSSLLIHPTRAKLRSECERLCKGELLKKDEKVIREFCEDWDNTRTCLQIIKDCDVDKFRPLVNFLKGNTENTDHRNIYLLAWLTDFPDRPFVDGKKYELPEDTQSDAEKPEPATDNYIDETPFPVKAGIPNSGTEEAIRKNLTNIEAVNPKRSFRKVLLTGVLLAATGAGGYLWFNWPGNGACMYWAKDHFQQIPCNQPIPNALVIALDTARLANFKKITKVSSITRQAIGRLWYSKINNEVEFFTAAGEHPVVFGRRLKPVTSYIISKYCDTSIVVNQ